MVRVGIIGAGFGTTGLVPAFGSIGACEVVVLPQARSGWRAFLERKDLDAVAIAVPPVAQFHVAKYAMEQGLHVFAEKPLAANLPSATELLTVAHDTGVVHCIDFMFPEIAQWRTVKEMLDSQTLGPCQHVAVDWTWLSGDLRYNRSTWRTNIDEGGGVLSAYFSHGFHYLEHFVGRIVDARCLLSHSARSANGGEVGADMLLTFENGVTGSVHVSCNSPGRVAHRLVFQCERGVIALENRDAVVDNFRVRTFTEDGERELAVISDRGRSSEDERVKIVRRVATRFIDACTGNGDMQHSSFAHGVRVRELMELARENAMRHGESAGIS
jgi:predicted dehydrogenase